MKEFIAQNMTELFLFILLILQISANFIDRRSAAKREKELLNRVMAKNLHEYAAATKTLKEIERPEKPVLTNEDIEAMLLEKNGITEDGIII